MPHALVLVLLGLLVLIVVLYVVRTYLVPTIAPGLANLIQAVIVILFLIWAISRVWPLIA